MKVFSKKRLLLLILSLYTFFAACAQPTQKSIEQLTSATVLLNDSSKVIPADVQKQFFYANFFYADSTVFLETLQKYANVQPIKLSLENGKTSISIRSGDILIVSATRLTITQNHDLADILNAMRSKGIQLILASYQDFSLLNQYNEANFPMFWSAMEPDVKNASFVAQAIMGGKACRATLAKDYSGKFKKGNGVQTVKNRIGYSSLSDLGFDNGALDELDVIAADAIRGRATPGLNVAVVKNGEVVFQKAYGRFTYDQGGIVQSVNHIFDLASVTKIMATTPYVMKLVEAGKIDLEEEISTYLPEFIGKPAQHVKVKELMLHEAGFIPYIPFYKEIKSEDFSADSSASFPVKVANHYFMRRNYFEDVMWKQMINSSIKTRGTYVYSDISMYVMRAIIQKVTASDLPKLLDDAFYKPLGLQHTAFNPWKSFKKNQITPTENDVYFRHQLLQGYVHDQGAAMAGGVSGHAGLFSSINDMAVFYQMLLNGGTYGGKRYLDSMVINQFTGKYHNQSRRGLGFDKMDIKEHNEYPSQYATPDLYGHTGYTGTCIWVSPKDDFIFIFLSNRVYPEVSNNLTTLKIRQRMLDEVYRTFISK